MTVRAVAPEGSRPRLTSRAGFLLIALTILALFAIAPAREYLSERDHVADLQQKAEGLERANAALRADIARLHDPAEKERLARECLGMVGEGEIAFVIGPRTGDSEPAPC
jgi:cell division protein FtsB